MYQRVGTRFGAYNIRHLLGAGGMAAVYYAVEAATQQPVALKILSAQLSHITAFRQRFELEAQITARLEHPHIVPVIGYGAVDDALYIAMRYLGGGSLHDRFVIDGTVALQETARYLNELASALDYAHGQGIIHRDLKLANVLLDEKNNVALSDFGIARMLESSLHLTESGSVLGSPHYMSPEQNEGKPLDARSDLYSLSVMVYLMITGQFPFHADTPVAIALQHVTKAPPPPTWLNAKLPAAVDSVLLKGLAKLPRDRFQTAAELAAAFESAIGDCNTQTMIHLPQLSLSRPTPPRIPTPPPPLIQPEQPTEPSLPAVKKRQSIFRYLAPVLLFIVLLAAFRVGLAQFGLMTDARSITETPVSITPRIIVLATITSTPPALATTRSYSVVVKNLYTPVNIRSGPAKVYSVIGQMYASDQALIVARTSTPDADGWYWYLIRTQQGFRVDGWVSGEVVDVLPANANPINIIVAVTIPPTPTTTNTASPKTFTPTVTLAPPG